MTGSFDWQGKVGNVWASESRRTDRSFTELTARLHARMFATTPQSGQAIDIGCGAGQTSIALAQARPGLAITGIDLSGGLLAIARSQAHSLSNLAFVQDDAAAGAASCAPVDLYVSRHGVMFFDNPVAAFTSFKAAASPSGHIVFSCFRDWTLNGFAYSIGALADNVAPRPDAPGPFAFADKDKVAKILSDAGWKNAEAESFDFSYIAGEGDDPVADAVSFMLRIGPASRAIADATDSKRPAMIDGLREICEDHLHGDRVLFPAAAWIWSAQV